MKLLFILTGAFFFVLTATGQTLKLHPAHNAQVLQFNNLPFPNTHSGGLNNPIFSSIDLNNDSLLDLFVFDRVDFRVLTFLADAANATNYVYAPQYEHVFPRMMDWAWLYDYDRDGKPDLFTHSSEAVGFLPNYLSVYRNVSTSTEVKFELVNPEVRAQNSVGLSWVYVNRFDPPILYDVDGDMDMDVITYTNVSQLYYYENVSMDRYGHSDSLEFELRDECWGKFVEGSNLNDIRLYKYCSNELALDKNAHVGSVPMGIDIDADGDMDMVMGDAESKELALLRNGRTQDSTYDIISSVDHFFPYNKKMDLPYLVQGHYIDVDNDGLKDFVASPMDVLAAKRHDFIWYYKNEAASATAPPVFIFKKQNFLEESIFDLGYRSAPAFFDYNNDGLMDLLIATSGNTDSSNTGDYLALYRNEGSADSPVYRFVTDDFLGYAAKKRYNLMPVTTDMDKDGDADLIIGDELGRIAYYRNIGGDLATMFELVTESLQHRVAGNLTTIDVGNKSAPAAADLDGDSWMDLLIGEGAGNINYYRNLGESALVPVFELVTQNFGNIKFPRLSAPCLADMDMNGKTDLISGDSTGNLLYYQDITDNLAGTLTGEKIQFYDHGKNEFSYKQFGVLLTPSVTFLDGDTIPDLVLGNVRGGLMFFTSKNNGYDTPSVSIWEPQPLPGLSFRVYPNPSRGLFTLIGLSGSIPFHSRAIITDLLGKEHLVQTLTTSEQAIIDLSGKSPGIYIIHLYDMQGHFLYSDKLLLSRP
ncbi:MAG: T9SS type A sorting domain-containing protein [Bacteroidota bacterium]|nr:T9SS type A sorting domain-containing protein [Bacteroidota bacterium]